MSLKSLNKKRNGKIVVYTLTTVVLLSTILSLLVMFLYNNTEEQAYETLHVQTKQIKDDIVLQIISDRENLTTMANFASKLYLDGAGYDLLFESFKPIGLIENIGILNPDGTFVTKSGTIDLSSRISFEEESKRGIYISGRISDLTREDYEIIRSAVPIVAKNEVVGVLYGVIKLSAINERYKRMATDIDAQLFVYNKEDGDLIIDTIHSELGNISFLKDRKYRQNYSYEEMISTDKGYTSFESVYRDENMHLHYSTIDEFGWMIGLARYDSQVFARMHLLIQVLLIVIASMILVMGLLLVAVMKNEKQTGSVTACASEIRKILLETSMHHDHITKALKQFCLFTRSRSTVFFDTEGDIYNYIAPEYQPLGFSEKDQNYFLSELIRYSSEYYTNFGTAISVFDIKPNARLAKKNRKLYEFFKEHNIEDVIFATTINNANQVNVLCLINTKYKKKAQMLVEKIVACFSIALHNKNYLNRTKLVATTDSLTGLLNRGSFMSDLSLYNEEKPSNFACVYIDVNELHLRNNKYGHAAGDEMLLYIANTLKEVFYGDKVYRMGGDEFLVLCKNSEQETIKISLDTFTYKLKLKDYHVSIGTSYRSLNTDTEAMVREAELRMYEDKASYYQNKEQEKANAGAEQKYIVSETGILEIDTMLSVLKEHYTGVFSVSLSNDTYKPVVMPASMKPDEADDRFSGLFSKYVSDSVDTDYHRAMLSVKNYSVLTSKLATDKIPRITYKTVKGDNMTLSIYKLLKSDNNTEDTLWVFEKKQK